MRSWTWVAFKEPVSQEVDWSRGLLSGSDPASAGSDALRYAIGSLADRRSFVRLVKSPSGELPSRVDDAVHVGASWNGGSFAPAVVDELRFATARSTRLANRRNFRLGLPPVAGSRGAGIGPDETTIPLHLAGGYTVAAALPGVRTSGGLLRIDDEIIGYADYDASTQSLTGCKRGMLGSEARDHSYAAAVSPVFGLPVARLEEAVTETSSRFVLSNYRGFPVWGGFARVGDEIVGYTRIDQNVLVMPEGRQVRKDGTFDPYADTNAGAGLFRGRYGTEATSHEAGEIVVCIDHRYPDMVREKADNSQMAFLQVGREVKGALWKRVSWDQRLRSLNGIRVLVRFEGGPGWDTDRIVRLDTDPVPDRDRHRWIYEVTDPLKLNLLNVQSDRIECRVFFTYEKGSFNPTASPAPDAWKETPWLQAFRIEYVAPSGVLTTEDLR
jgi:hypothetical protein